MFYFLKLARLSIPRVIQKLSLSPHKLTRKITTHTVNAAVRNGKMNQNKQNTSWGNNTVVRVRFQFLKEK